MPRLLPSLALLLCTHPLHADESPAAIRLDALFRTFIAPCCWRENLAVHHSPKASELRVEIEALVREGKSDDDIKTAFVSQYSSRILALPEGHTGRWLAWMPWAFASAGLLVVVAFIKRSVARSIEGSAA